MRLTVLGCAGSFPGPHSACSSYLLEHEGFRLLLDCGSGSLGALQRETGGLDVDAVHLSHLHADHCLDLVGWSIARRYHPDGQPPPLPVYAPPGAQRRLERALDGGKLDGVYRFSDTRAGRLDIGPFELELARMAHPVETYGTRVSAGGRSVGYSADTGPCAGLSTVARDVDVLLAEASFLEGRPNPPRLHLTAREAAEAAVRGGAGRLVLTHLVSWHDEGESIAEAAAVWGDQPEVARPGLVVDLG